MTSIENVLRGADEDAATLGHSIVWSSIDEATARGHCSGCGRDVRVASSEDGPRERAGRALREACTHDFVMKKPTLQRSPEPRLERTPVPSQS